MDGRKNLIVLTPKTQALAYTSRLINKRSIVPDGALWGMANQSKCSAIKVVFTVDCCKQFEYQEKYKSHLKKILYLKITVHVSTQTGL